MFNAPESMCMNKSLSVFFSSHPIDIDIDFIMLLPERINK